MIMGLVDL